MRTFDAVVALLLAWACAMALADWRWRRVPNAGLLALLLPAAALLLWRGEGLRAIAWPMSLAGALAGFALTWPGYLGGQLGAGDVKLSAVTGLVLGWPAVLPMLLVSALLLGLMALAALALRRSAAPAPRLPAAVALAGGFAATLLSGGGIT